MAMMDTVRKLMQGKSELVERSIDKAVEYLGRSSDSFKKQGETIKAKARALDPDHPEGAAAAGTPTTTTPSSTPPPPPPPAPAVTPPTATPAVPSATPPPASDVPVPPVAPSPGLSLRGDLVDPPEPTTPS